MSAPDKEAGPEPRHPGPRAPALARALLRLSVPAPRREDVIGDLNEVHARRRSRHGRLRAWILTSGEALTVSAAFLGGRIRDASSRATWLTWPEVKLTLRMARKQPLLNAAAVLALATGIGLSAAAYTLVDTTIFARLPVPHGERFVRIDATETEGGARANFSRERLDLFVRGSGALDYLGVGSAGNVNVLDGDGAVEAVHGIRISPDAFRVFPWRPLAGRTLIPADGAPGAPPVALIGARLWARRFGADPGVVGRRVDFSGTKREIVGVMPEEAGFPDRPDVFLPFTSTDLDAAGTPEGPNLLVFGVLAKGVDAAHAESRLAALSRDFEGEHAEAPALRVRVRPFTEIPQQGMLQLLLVSMLTAVIAVLLVIAANVGSLVAARTAARRGELAVRTALGASRTQLVAQLFAEVLVLGMGAAALAAIGVEQLMSHLSVWLRSELPFWVDLMPSAATWAFMGGVTVLACLVGGALPALHATRGAPGDALRFVGRGGGGPVLGRTGGVVAVLQMAMSVALLGAALLAMRGMALYAGGHPSLPEDRILAAGMSVSPAPGGDSVGATYARIESVVARVPGVERLGITTALPRVEAPAVPVSVEPTPGEVADPARLAPVVEARPGFLETLGATARAGRLIEPQDLLPGAEPVAVVNESFVRKFLHGRNPIGRRVRIVSASAPGEPAPEAREIVGVVPDLGISTGDPTLEAGLYVPLTAPAWVYLTASVSGDPAAVADRVRRALAHDDPTLLVPLVRTLDHMGSENAATLALFGGLLGAMGAMALLLSVVSTYALVSFTAARRVREVGIRVALGASRAQVMRTVAGRAALQVALGAALGAPLGLLLIQTRRLFVFRVPSGEPWLLPLVALVMAGAGVLAGWVPARRALAVRPSEALNAE